MRELQARNSSDEKISSTSEHFKFSSISSASQDIKQYAAKQNNTQATVGNDILIIQHLLKLFVNGQNASERHKTNEDVADLPSLQTPSFFSKEHPEQIRARLSSSSDSDLSSLIETILSKQEQQQQQILADFLTSNSQQQQQHLSQHQEHENMLTQLISSLAQQQRQQEQHFDANRMNSQTHLLLQLLNQNVNASGHHQDSPQLGVPNNEVAQFPSYSEFTSDPLQNLLSSFPQQLNNGSTTDSQSLLTALLNATPGSSSAETTTMSKMGQDAYSGTLPLATPTDSERKLSDYQVLLRQQLEFFVAQHSDVDSSTQGRRKQVHLGQVGLRCRHCAHLPLRSRERGAVYYPAKLENVYQAAQNMASTHLMESCKNIDVSTRRELQELRDRKHTAMGGKTQWAEACQEMGLYEAEDSGLRLSTAPFHSS